MKPRDNTMKTETMMATLAVALIGIMSSMTIALAGSSRDSDNETVFGPQPEQSVIADSTDSPDLSWIASLPPPPARTTAPVIRTMNPVYLKQLKNAEFDDNQFVMLPAGCGFNRQVAEDGTETFVDVASGNEYSVDGILIQEGLPAT